MIVVDASALVEFFLRTPSGLDVEQRLFEDDSHAPHLIDLEVAQVLRRCALTGQISELHGRDALRIMAELPLQRHGHQILLPRIWELRDNVTSYDAAYIALAELLDATLLTRDRRLARAAGRHLRVELL